jgi:type I site-specific restriction endonuclease
MIDPQLEKAGWILRDHSKVKEEIPVDGYDAERIRFLRAVQSVFLQKRHLETADLYEPSLDSFGVDAVERLFTKEIYLKW